MSLFQRTRVARALGDIVPPFRKFSSEESSAFHSGEREKIGENKKKKEKKGGEKMQGGTREGAMIVKERWKPLPFLLGQSAIGH